MRGPAPGERQLDVRARRPGQPHRLRPAGVPQVQRERGGRPRSCGSAARPRPTTASSAGGASGASSARSGSRPVGGDPERVGRGRRVPGGDAGQRVERRRRDAEDVGRRARGRTAGHGRVDVGRRDLGGRGLAQHPGHAEVGEHRPPFGREDDVARGQVAVDDAVAVRVGERRRDRRDRGDHLAGTQPPPAGEQRGEAAALEQLEDQRDPGLRRRGGADGRPRSAGRGAGGRVRRAARPPGPAAAGSPSTSTLTATGGAAPARRRPPDLTGTAAAEPVVSGCSRAPPAAPPEAARRADRQQSCRRP